MTYVVMKPGGSDADEFHRVPLAADVAIAPEHPRVSGRLAGAYLSTATINRCIHEAGRAVEPLENSWRRGIRRDPLCELYRDSPHEKTRALAREFLNDWEAIWIVLSNTIPPCATITRRRLSQENTP